MPKNILCKLYSLQVVQNNNGRYVSESCAHVSSDLSSCVPPKPPEPPDTSTPGHGGAQWFVGFLHVMSGMANFIMTIPVGVKHSVSQLATKVRTLNFVAQILRVEINHCYIIIAAKPY